MVQAPRSKTARGGHDQEESLMSPQRFTKPAAIAVTLAAIAAPATAGAQDLRSPDARDGARVVTPGHDLRSPDARSGTTAPQAVSFGADLRSPDARPAVPPAVRAGTDLRSPDSRDAGEGRGTFSAPDVMVVKVREPAPATAPAADGMDWSDAGIGAGVLLGIALLALGGFMAVTHHRGTATPA
jgi:hypothetical protein